MTVVPVFVNPETGELLKSPTIGVTMWSKSVKWNDGEHPDLQSPVGGHLIGIVDGPDGVLAYRLAGNYRGKVRYETLAADDVNWDAYTGYVRKDLVHQLAGLLNLEMSRDRRGTRYPEHMHTLMVLTQAVGLR